MKRIIAIVCTLLLLGAMGFNAYSYFSHVARDQDDIVDMVCREYGINRDGGLPIACISEYTMDDGVLVWVRVGQPNATEYKAVECEVRADGAYIVKQISNALEDSEEIVMTVWNSRRLFLINNPKCRMIEIRDSIDGSVEALYEVPEEYPYIFNWSHGNRISFLDAEGNVIIYG